MSAGKGVPEYGEVFAQLSLHPGLVVAAAATVALLWAGGRLVLRRADAPQTVAAGMGLFVFPMTLVGVAALDLRFGLAAYALVAIGALVLRRGDAAREPALSMLKALVLLLPLALLVSGRHGSEWDEFSHWLRAFRYLVTNNVLPGGPQVPTFDGCCGAYPYGWPLLAYTAAQLTGFAEALPGLINVMVLGLSGLLLAEVARRELGATRLSWAGIAAALFAATLGGPAFVAKLAFTSYADVSTGFLVATLVVLGETMISDQTEGRNAWTGGLGFGLCAAALLSVKPGNAGLLACALAGVLLVMVRQRGWRGLLRPELLPAVVLPMAISMLWRWHVGKYLAGQEMVIQPLSLWNLGEMSTILSGMVGVATQKGGHFSLGLIAVILGARGLRRCDCRFDRLAIQVAVLFAGYNVFLFTTYVAVFGRDEARMVASFWRYNTHLGLAVMVPAALLAARLIKRAEGRPWLRRIAAAAIVLVLVGPVAVAPYVRFDADSQKQWNRRQLRDLMTRLPAGDRVAVFDSHGSGLANIMATYEWNDRLALGGTYSGFTTTDPLVWQRNVEAPWILVLSGRERLLGDKIPEGVLLHHQGDSWEIADRFPYPGSKFPAVFP
jgi:hypothetical protein